MAQPERSCSTGRSAQGQLFGGLSWERTLEMVAPQVEAGLYWVMATTPSAIRALMLAATSQFGSGPAEHERYPTFNPIFRR